MFGTDRSTGRGRLSELAVDEQGQILDAYRENVLTGIEAYQSHEKLMVRGKEIQGLGLPEDVMEKILYRNAEKWFPGI